MDFDDIRTLRILDRAAELGLIVLSHSGLDVGFPGVVHVTPRMVRSALDQVGPMTLILAHMGGWRNWDQVEELLPDTSVYLDTSYVLGTCTPGRRLLPPGGHPHDAPGAVPPYSPHLRLPTASCLAPTAPGRARQTPWPPSVPCPSPRRNRPTSWVGTPKDC